MIKVKEAVIVEGKYDKIRLSNIIDGLIIETGGFSIFKDNEKLALIRRLAEMRGIVILTDSDSAGFAIRNYIGGAVPPERVRHAYIPDIYGKERRKQIPSREGKLGVEGVDDSVILRALRLAGVDAEQSGSGQTPARMISKTDFYTDGLTGGQNSAALREKLKKELGLPRFLSTSRLLDIVNVLLTYEEYRRIIDRIKEEHHV